MGTALRFVTGFAGVLCIVMGLAVAGPAIVGATYVPDDSDFPGGLRAVIALQLIVGSWPLALGVYLLRKAVKAGSARLDTRDTVRTAPPPVVETLETAETPEPAAPPIVAPPVATTPAVAPAVVATPTHQPVSQPRRRRTWLAVIGLCVTLPGLLILVMTVVEIARGSLPSDRTPWDVTVLVLLTGVVPVLVGLRLAYAGDANIGRRFGLDLRRSLTALRERSTRRRLMRTSAGLAFVTAAVSLLSMAIWKEGSPLIAFTGTTLFSIVDPVLNFWRRSWWIGAFISIPVWIALFITLAYTAEAIAPMREAAMIFIFPMMAYPAALGLSGLARFWMWAGRRSNPEAFN